MEHVQWITDNLRSGTLGAIAVKIDRGLLPGNTRLDADAAAMIKEHALRSSQHLDDVLRGFRDSHFHTLDAGERHDLLRVIQRHTDPGFATVAVAYPSLKSYINSRRTTLVGGGGSELAASFVATFDGDDFVRDTKDGERAVGRRRPGDWSERVQYDGELDDTMLSGWTEKPIQKQKHT